MLYRICTMVTLCSALTLSGAAPSQQATQNARLVSAALMKQCANTLQEVSDLRVNIEQIDNRHAQQQRERQYYLEEKHLYYKHLEQQLELLHYRHDSCNDVLQQQIHSLALQSIANSIQSTKLDMATQAQEIYNVQLWYLRYKQRLLAKYYAKLNSIAQLYDVLFSTLLYQDSHTAEINVAHENNTPVAATGALGQINSATIREEKSDSEDE